MWPSKPRAAHPSKRRVALGFLTGQEMTWLPRAMALLRDHLPEIDVTVSSDYSPDLADALARGKIDRAFLRAEPGFDLVYRAVRREPLVVLMPSDHALESRPALPGRPKTPGELNDARCLAVAILREVIRTAAEALVLSP